jgi:ankyrin repeat protein
MHRSSVMPPGERLTVSHVVPAGFTPLHYAIEGGNIDIVEMLLQSGEYDDPGLTSPRTTPLHVAMQYGHIDILPMLTSRGYSPLEKTVGEKTTVHLAAQGLMRCETGGAGVMSDISHEQCLTAMLGVGVDPKVLDASGCSPLHYGAGDALWYTVMWQHD